jgi:methyl-accepting chemotaxis protein
VNELIREIAVASREQSAGVEEMNKALMQLESVTQQNAALVEEAAASAPTFKDEASQLFTIVSRFRLDEEDQLPRAEPRPRMAVPPAAKGPPIAGPMPRELGYKRKAAATADDEWQEF